jgi:hypothetical protein
MYPPSPAATTHCALIMMAGSAGWSAADYRTEVKSSQQEIIAQGQSGVLYQLEGETPGGKASPHWPQAGICSPRRESSTHLKRRL